MVKKDARLELLDVSQNGKLVIILPDNRYGIRGLDVWVDNDGIHSIGFAKETAPNCYEELEHSWNDQEQAEILLSLFPESALAQLRMEVASFGSMSESHYVDLFIQHIQDKQILEVYSNEYKIARLSNELIMHHNNLLKKVHEVAFSMNKNAKGSNKADLQAYFNMYNQTKRELEKLGYELTFTVEKKEAD